MDVIKPRKKKVGGVGARLSDEEMVNRAVEAAEWILKRHFYPRPEDAVAHFNSLPWSRRNRRKDITERAWQHGVSLLQEADVLCGHDFRVAGYAGAVQLMSNRVQRIKQEMKEPGFEFPWEKRP